MNTRRTRTPDAALAPFRLSDPVLLPVADMAAGVPADRAHSDGVRVFDLGAAGAGRCDYGREKNEKGKSAGGYRVTALHLPSISDARGRLIRAHELLHAADTPARRRTDKLFPHVVTNTCEDVDVHCNRWPRRRVSHLTRDALAVALADVRGVCNASAAGRLEPGSCSDEDWNMAVAVLARSLGIVRGAHKGARSESQRERTARAARRVADLVRARFGATMLSVLSSDVLQSIERDRQSAHRHACEALAALMRFSPPPSDDEGAPVDRDGQPAEKDEPNENGEPGGAETNERPPSPLRVECLPLLDACDPLRSSRGRARRGARFNAPRLALAVASGSLSGLFLRNRQNTGGAVLIDASGSMGFSQETLSALALEAPAATIGYYAGHGRDKRGHIGTLRVFARNGKRSRTCPRKGGANDVDVWAVRWLLRQRGPRVLVSDLQFCGGPNGQAAAATAEVDRARRAGGLIVAPDVETARNVFRRLKGGEAPATIAADVDKRDR